MSIIWNLIHALLRKTGLMTSLSLLISLVVYHVDMSYHTWMVQEYYIGLVHSLRFYTLLFQYSVWSVRNSKLSLILMCGHVNILYRDEICCVNWWFYSLLVHPNYHCFVLFLCFWRILTFSILLLSAAVERLLCLCQFLSNEDKGNDQEWRLH